MWNGNNEQGDDDGGGIAASVMAAGGSWGLYGNSDEGVNNDDKQGDDKGMHDDAWCSMMWHVTWHVTWCVTWQVTKWWGNA